MGIGKYCEDCEKQTIHTVEGHCEVCENHYGIGFLTWRNTMTEKYCVECERQTLHDEIGYCEECGCHHEKHNKSLMVRGGEFGGFPSGGSFYDEGFKITFSSRTPKEIEIENMAACMVSILDSLKLIDNGDDWQLNDETLSEIMFRKMKGYNVDLNKILGVSHLCPVKKLNK